MSHTRVLGFASFFIASALLAQAPKPTPAAPARPRAASVPATNATVDSVIAALYESVSHGNDAEPNWNLMREVFLPVGQLIPPKRPQEDRFTVLDVDGFQERVRKGAAAAKAKGDPTSFFEKEVARQTDCFGNVCQLFSTYEARRDPSDAKPFVSGINSIQLVRDETGWHVASIVWDVERPDNPIPSQYAAKPKP
jgi:hypothetical protein